MSIYWWILIALVIGVVIFLLCAVVKALMTPGW
jgi:hypothetical protein